MNVYKGSSSVKDIAHCVQPDFTSLAEQSEIVRTAEGIVTADPLDDAAVGATIHISADLFIAKPEAGLTSIANWDYFDGAVVAIHFGEPESQRVMGSGVFVAPGVVMTARHVIEPEQDVLIAGHLEIICTGILSAGLTIWRCHSATLIGNADFAFLMVSSGSALPRVLRQATLTTRMPKVGERLYIAGIRHLSAGPVPIDATLKLSMMVGQGLVTARYERARDRVILPSPCVEVDCPALGGMSGGPAFDENGFLIGLITSSLEGDGNGPTFLSLSWPALIEPITPCWPSGLYKSPISLLDMDRRLCAIDRAEAIQISIDESTGTSVATYHHWDS